MQSYLVEAYLSRRSGGDLSGLVERIRSATDVLARQGKDVAYLRSTFLPEDEVCLHWFEASSKALVGEATAGAAIECDRIVEAVAE